MNHRAHPNVRTNGRTAFFVVLTTVAALVPFAIGAFAFADEPRKTIRLPPGIAIDAAAWQASGASGDAAADAGFGPNEFRITKTPPDPAPLVAKTDWIFDLRYDHGDIFLTDTRTLDLAAPQATPRAMGRFALELFEGPTLIERVRFDFPFLGATEERKDGGTFFQLDRRVITKIGVFFPQTTRGTRLELRDRATEERWALPWPPPAAPVAASGQMNTR